MREKLLILGLLVNASFALECNEALLEKHLPFMPQDVKIAKAREVFGICEYVVEDRESVFTLYASEDFALAGAMFSKGQPVSRESVEEVQKERMKNLLGKLSALHVAEIKGSQDKVMYMISDPDCPFCEGAKNKVVELAKKNNWTLRLVWFPLPIHPQAYDKAVSFVCEKRTWEDYLKGLYGTSKCEEGIKKVSESVDTVEPYVSGTPLFVFSDGTIIQGGNMKALQEKMK